METERLDRDEQADLEAELIESQIEVSIREKTAPGRARAAGACCMATISTCR